MLVLSLSPCVSKLLLKYMLDSKPLSSCCCVLFLFSFLRLPVSVLLFLSVICLPSSGSLFLSCVRGLFCLSVPTTIHLSVYLSICAHQYPSVLCMSLHLSVCLSVYLSVCTSQYLLSVTASIHTSIDISVWLSVCLSVYPCPPVSVCLSPYASLKGQMTHTFFC